MSAPKNLPASVKARLEAVAKKRGEQFNLVLVRYGIERLLYRLSQSRYAGQFVLKGAMLFAVWDETTHRPTRDLDLLGFGATGRDDLAQVLREVAATKVQPDGLEFSPESVEAEEIREDNTYGGIRIRLLATLGKAKIPVQIDIGVGDAVTPSPEEVVFPVLLDFPAPRIRAYPVYTVFAEKLEAMVKLGIVNTRMKDYFDLLFLIQRFDLDPVHLREAIRATFSRRGTPPPVPPEPFTEALAGDPAKQTQWTAFLRRNGLAPHPARFSDAVAQLSDYIAPILARP